MGESLTSTLFEILKAYGPLGIFLVSFIGNAVPYSTIPYLFFIALYGAALDTVGQIYVAILSGLGATLGKVVVLMIGRAARVTLSEETKKNLDVFRKISEKSMAFAIFLFAALPLPDDVLYVPLGVSGYSAAKFFISALAGKIVITWVTLAFSGIVVGFTVSYPWWISISVLVFITVVATYLIVKIRWVEVLRVYESEGFVAGTEYLIQESIKILIRDPISRLRGGGR